MTRKFPGAIFTGIRKRAALRAVFERDGERCRHCGVRVHLPYAKHGRHPPDTATLDHVVPQSRGGTDEIANLMLACRRCNEDRGNMDVDAFRERLVRLGRVPA